MHNQCEFIGNLGRDPEVKTFNNGGKVCNLRLAVSEKWRDKESGERKEHTEWISVAVFQEGLIRVCEQYLKKGSKVFVQGKMKTRKYQDQSGNDRYSTEVVLQGFGGKLVMLDGKSGGDSGGGSGGYGGGYGGGDDGPSGGGSSGGTQYGQQQDLDDEIPF
jgi:single-strand DNA-binding protein